MTTGGRAFGASRDNGARAHAGVDIIPTSGPNSKVYAMTDGTVQRYALFYAGTYALEVKNSDGTVARYCEITSTLKVGDNVTKGQEIGKIIRNTAGGSYMLHLEMYMGTKTGSLTDSSNSTYDYVPAKEYNRRADLLDPMGVIKLR
jgi:murein DD-endopeptidase MepM/ murein hydrolase activator NlpD